LAQTASITNTLADRDELIGQVITNLNTVLGSLADRSAQFGETVDALSQLVDGLANRKEDITTGLAHADAAAVTIADLLRQTRKPFSDTVKQSDRATSIVLADHEYLEKLLDDLPDNYQVAARQGIYGDFFSFYLCDLLLKVNGKGGQPVYIKVAGQDSGRCTPK
jgi:phospholipid/cholesterol/gamma-HCH transport system substrate-binding protein